MTIPTVSRADLLEHGVSDEDRFAVYWQSDDGQAELLLGLGPDEDYAMRDAEREAKEVEVQIQGGQLVAHQIIG